MASDCAVEEFGLCIGLSGTVRRGSWLRASSKKQRTRLAGRRFADAPPALPPAAVRTRQMGVNEG